MTHNDALVTVTLPRWYVERLSEEVERETLHYGGKVRVATRKAVPEWLEKMRTLKARWDAVEAAITDALDGDDVSGGGNIQGRAQQ